MELKVFLGGGAFRSQESSRRFSPAGAEHSGLLLHTVHSLVMSDLAQFEEALSVRLVPNFAGWLLANGRRSLRRGPLRADEASG